MTVHKKLDLDQRQAAGGAGDLHRVLEWHHESLVAVAR
jgi:hypothetical protein